MPKVDAKENSKKKDTELWTCLLISMIKPLVSSND